MNNSINNRMGGLIWITGYSGAGKTATAQKVYERLFGMDIPVVLLDGDDLRSILGEKFGHELDERKQLASVYGRLCKKLSDSGVIVVIATIAMFEAVRKENRLANDLYLEVYLDVPLEVRADRDPKGLYKAAKLRGVNIGEYVLGMEEPQNPDLVIKNYGDVTSDISSSMVVTEFLRIAKKGEETVRKNSLLNDEIGYPVLSRAQYWNSYYEKRKAPIAPSSFALFCAENYLFDHSHILEFGCGNGRDSFYFSKSHRVSSIDESMVAIEANQVRASQDGIFNIDFLHGEFGTAIIGLPAQVDAVYSRFVMHAMPEDAETRALNESWRLLKPNGRLFLEFRTIQDPLMGKGEHLSETERKTDHYRRFIDFTVFCKKLQNVGFTLEYTAEKQGLAVYGDDDPVVGRVVATKSING